MAETEISSTPSRAFEAARGADSALPAIAISEENLLALLGSSALSDADRITSAAPARTTAPVEIALARRSLVQPPLVQPPALPSFTEQAAAVQPQAVSSPAEQLKAEETGNSATPTPPPQARPDTIDGTLALLATIRETRAGLSRKETSRPDRVQPEASHSEALAPAALHAETPHAEEPSSGTAATTPFAKAPVPEYDSLPRFLTAAPARSPLHSAMGKLSGGRRTFMIVGALIVVGGISTGLVLGSRGTAKHRAMASPSPAMSRAAAASFPLRLQLEAQGKGQVNVRWNPQSTLVAQAQQGRLVVTEANQLPRTIPLALNELKAGHLTYQQVTERAAFRLEVVDSTGAVAEESVLSPSIARP